MVRISRRNEENTPIQTYVVMDAAELPFRQPAEDEIIFLTPVADGYIMNRFLKEEIEQTIVQSRI